MGGSGLVIIVGVRFGTGTIFSDNPFDVEIFGVVGKDSGKFFKIFFKFLEVFGVFVPGNEVHSEIVFVSKLKKVFEPIFVKSSNGGSADFKRVYVLSGLGAFDGVVIESLVVGILFVMPIAKKIRFIPDFIVDSGQVEIVLAGIMFNSCLNQVFPFSPVFRGIDDGTVLGKSRGHVGKDEHGFGAGLRDSLNGLVKSGKVVASRSLIDVEEVVDVVKADVLRRKGLGLRNDGSDHVFGFFAALG